MQPVIQSVFLQALGYAIINSLWQFALLWLVYYVINLVFKLTSSQKYNTAIILQSIGLTWFLVTTVFYYKKCSQLFDELSVSGESLNFTYTYGSSVKETIFSWISKTEQFLPYLSVAYLALLVFLSFKWIKAYGHAQNIKTSGLEKIDVEWRLFVQKLAFQMGIKKKVTLFLSKNVTTPLTIGFLKPVILVPFASINNLSVQQMEAVLLHELAHIKRFDYLVNLVLAFAEATLFFNPFMQLISKQIKRERENCCDDWVLQYEYNPATYARALLTIATFGNITPAFALKATDDKQMLLTRVKRIIERKEKSIFNYKHQLYALMIMTVVFSSVSLFSEKPNVASANINGKLKVEPLAARVKNPLFNPVFFFADERLLKSNKEIVVKPELLIGNEIPLTKVDSRRKASSTNKTADLKLAPVSSGTNMEFNFVDLKLPSEDFTKLIHTKADKISKESQKIYREAVVIKRNALVEKQKMIAELKAALADLKTKRKEIDLGEFKQLVPGLIDNLKENKQLKVSPVEVAKLKKEIESVISNLQQQLEEAKKEVNFYAANIDNEEEVPAVYATAPVIKEVIREKPQYEKVIVIEVPSIKDSIQCSKPKKALRITRI